MLALRTIFWAWPLLVSSVYSVAVPSAAESSIESRHTSLEARGVECNWGRYGLKRCAANGNLEQCTTTSMTTIKWVEVKCAKGCKGSGGMEMCA